VVLADEPTGNLDSATGQEILDMFSKLRRETGFALVVVTHDEKVAAAADRHIRLHDGEVVA
jgi:putative ABC transport system ATP-binding protein